MHPDFPPKRYRQTGLAGLSSLRCAWLAMALLAAPVHAEADGTTRFAAGDLALSLDNSSQTAAHLQPSGEPGFDFTPGDLAPARAGNGYQHLGDLHLLLRTSRDAPWRALDTASDRHPVAALPLGTNDLAAADLGPTLPADLPISVERHWRLENGHLVLQFRLRNTSKGRVEIGGLGMPLVFNNILTGRTLAQAYSACSFSDPYIGADAGYVQVTRLSGRGSVLLVVPDGRTPLEAWQPLLDRPDSVGTRSIFTDPTPRSVTFEGFYDWLALSKAYADTEWGNARPWNTPTSLVLAPGEARSFGLAFLLAPSVRQIEQTLTAARRPVAVGAAGYVLPADMPGRLFLKYRAQVRSIRVEPAGAIVLHREPDATTGWQAYTLRGREWGRAHVSITYADGVLQTIHYRVIKPAAQAVTDMGHFLSTRQWFEDPADPFHRSPSILSYDRERDELVRQDNRVWIAGLSDEAGAGSWLALAMKQLGLPDREQLDKLERFVDEVLWGALQVKDGGLRHGVHKSLFYYDPASLPAGYYRPDLDWSTWTSWKRDEAYSVGRSFNYPHVTAVWWVLYRVARNTGLPTRHRWDSYLRHAYETSMAMVRLAPEYAQYGQMEGDVFVEVLNDLFREGWLDEARLLQSAMRRRADHWKSEAWPFGSEMPWDSTGQEEVYAWTSYFGYGEQAAVTLDAILGYDPTVPHWGYDGSARRYWDFLYGGKYRRIERQLHHYGSGINAIPVLAEYRSHPQDLYLLRVGFAGSQGVLTNIDQDGFLAPAFHAFPDMLRPDPLSGDNGPNFFGYALNAATYVVHSDDFGWLAFGGEAQARGGTIRVIPRDAFHTRLYLAPGGLWITLDSGRIESLEYRPRDGTVRLGLSPADEYTREARLRIARPAGDAGGPEFQLSAAERFERGAYVFPLSRKVTWVTMNPNRGGD